MKVVSAILMAGLVAAETCKVSGVSTGACTDVDVCKSYGGTPVEGLCSGDSSRQCCINIPCGENNDGLCMYEPECDGTTHTGLCPGTNDFVCCTGINCKSGAGTCKWSCSGTAESGYCPGPSSFQCCTGGDTPTPGPDPEPSNNTAAQKIVETALAMVGKYPYSWAGGDNHGPTYGIEQDISPYCDDTGVIGFDCSGLAKYAVYQGTGVSLYHQSQVQYDDGPKVALSQRQPGDLVFFGDNDESIHHVAIYIGDDMMVEAPGHNSDCSGMLVRKKELRTYDIINKVARYW